MTEHYSSDARHEIAEALTGFLADTAVVYYKTHTFHWNVEGANFYGAHIMFEKFYKNLWKSMDDIAERIRAFSTKTPPSLEVLLKSASIEEAEAAPAVNIMFHNLLNDYIALSKRAHDVGAIAEKHGDRASADLMTQRSAFIEKAAWMLQSSIT